MSDETPESAMELLCQEEMGVVRLIFPRLGGDDHCTGKLVVYAYRNSDVSPPEDAPEKLALVVEDIRDRQAAIPGRVVIALSELSEGQALRLGQTLVALAKSSPRSIELAAMDRAEVGDPEEN
jgi:hypothetical protein